MTFKPKTAASVAVLLTALLTSGPPAAAGGIITNPPKTALSYMEAGVWELGPKGVDDDIRARPDLTSFQITIEQKFDLDQRLVDVETFLVKGERQYAGVWQTGFDGQAFVAGLDEASFLDEWQLQSTNGLELIDLETYRDQGDVRRYLGLFRTGSGVAMPFFGLGARELAGLTVTLRRYRLHIVDVESYKEGQTRLYAAIFAPGGQNQLFLGRPFDDFEPMLLGREDEGQRLVDLEFYQEGDERHYLSIWKPSNVEDFVHLQAKQSSVKDTDEALDPGYLLHDFEVEVTVVQCCGSPPEPLYHGGAATPGG